MKTTVSIDKAGRKTQVLLPDDAPDSQAHMGIVVGPPDLSDLKLPKEIEVRLHNALYDRGIITKEQAKAKRMDVLSALQSAFKVDVGRIVDLYPESTRTKVNGVLR